MAEELKTSPVTEEPTDQAAVDVGEGDVGTVEPQLDVATETQEPEQEPWRGYFEQIGLTDVDDLDTGLGRLTQAYLQRNEQLQQLADSNRQLAEELRARSRGYQQPVSEPVAPAPAQQQDDPFSMPSLPPNIERFRVKRRNESGQEEWDWAEDTPANIRDAGEQYAAKMVDFQTRVLTPQGFKEILDAYLDRQIVPRVEQQYQSRQQEQLDAQVENQWLQQNDWFYEKDAVSGTVLSDPITEQPRVSLEGRKFLKLMEELQADGVASFQRRLSLADQMYRSQRQVQQQQPIQQRQAAAQANDAAKKAMLGRKATPSTANPSRQQGAVGGEDPKDRTGYGRRLVESLRANGVELEV
jgi:hypothetical protein